MLRVGAVLLLLVILNAIGVDATDAANRCVRIHRQGNIETLINRCDVCQVATITRSRPGSEVPTGRQLNVQANSTFPVPFRGPGRSRITGQHPCKGERGGQKDLLEEFSKPNSEPKCVTMERTGNSSIALINRCGECRAVAIERVREENGQRARDYMLIVGRGRLPVRSQGYSSVGLLAEIACP